MVDIDVGAGVGGGWELELRGGVGALKHGCGGRRWAIVRINMPCSEIGKQLIVLPWERQVVRWV